MKEILLAILLLHTATASALNPAKFLAYHTSPPLLSANAKDPKFSARTITRRGVLGRAGPHRRCTTIALKNRGIEADDASDDTMQYHSPVEEDESGFPDNYNDWLFHDRKQRVAFYGSLAFLETVFWYYLAPGIDPQSRWFSPVDGQLISSLLDPSIVLSPPVGSGLGFSSLLLNSFLILPMVWSLLLLQEGRIDNHDDSSSTWSLPNGIIRTSVCAAGFFVGGGILIPYMIFRRPLSFRRSINPQKFPAPLRLFEERDLSASATNSIPSVLLTGQVLFVCLVSFVVTSFVFPFVSHHNDWIVEWNAFSERARSSQFTALALYDFVMISITVLDPMMDDAIRRGYVVGWETRDDGDFDVNQWRSERRENAIRKLAPYVVVPLIGPVVWICLRPRYGCSDD